tara:strand:+ start:130 stop:1530 length:1401 start_codon:yes stop_codon:yes gene_type:complete
MNKYFKIILFGLLILNGCSKNETAYELVARINDEFNWEFTTAEKSTNQKLMSLLNEKDSNGNYLYAMPSAGWPEDNLGNRGNLIYYRDGSGKATLGGYSSLVTESGSWRLDWDSRACYDNSTAELLFKISHLGKFSNVIGKSNMYLSRVEDSFSDTSLVNKIYSLINSDCDSYIKNNNLMFGVNGVLDECKEDGTYFGKYLRIEKDPRGWAQPQLREGVSRNYVDPLPVPPIWNTLIDSVKYTIKDCKIVEHTVFHKEQKDFILHGEEQPDLLADEYWQEVYNFNRQNNRLGKKTVTTPASTRHNNKACEGHTFKYNNGKKHGVWADDEVYKNGSKIPGSGKVYTYYSNGNVETITQFEGEKYVPSYPGSSSGYYRGDYYAKRYSFYESGNFKDETNYIYDTHGTKQSHFRKDGMHTAWHENGEINIRGLFKDDKWEGLWDVFDKNGVLTNSLIYKDGELIDRMDY